MKGWKNIFHANGKQKKAGVAMLILNKIDLKIKKITRDKEGHYIMMTKINKNKILFIEKINKTGKPLARLIKKKDNQINKISPTWKRKEQSRPRGTKSPIQDKTKEKHTKAHTNQTNKD